MPRVLYVHHRPQASGAVRSLALLVGALDPAWDAHVLVPDGPAATVLADAGATVHRGPVPAFTHTWDVQYHGLRWLVLGRELVSVPGHLRRLGGLLETLRPDVVHLNDGVLLASGRLAHRRGAKVVWHLRSSLAHGGRDRRSRWVAGRLDEWGDAAIAIDGDVARTFPLQLPVEVVPNPVVAESGAAADLGVPAGRVAVGFFGYLRRQKGWPELVEAARLLVDAGAPVQIVVVGGGVRPPEAFRGVRGRVLRAAGVPDEERDLRARVAELDLSDHFTFLPFTTEPGSRLPRARRRRLPEPGRRPRPPGARGGRLREAGGRVGVTGRRGAAAAGRDGDPACATRRRPRSRRRSAGSRRTADLRDRLGASGGAACAEAVRPRTPSRAGSRRSTPRSADARRRRRVGARAARCSGRSAPCARASSRSSCRGRPRARRVASKPSSLPRLVRAAEALARAVPVARRAAPRSAFRSRSAVDRLGQLEDRRLDAAREVVDVARLAVERAAQEPVDDVARRR